MVKSVSSPVKNNVKVCKNTRISEFSEMKDMIGKLHKIVSPFMPRERKVSKLEVIEHVIEYINELTEALEAYPAGKGLSQLASQIATRSLASEGLVLSPLSVRSVAKVQQPSSPCSQEVSLPQTEESSPGRDIYC
ncbi:protein extra-macrochaetae-like [Artemia franciscana]|uniref:protein extra-macrochaetae-like n=1 Tax=Artemia franciscana TaxID=6661 RepID=UPI0032DADBF7